MAYTPKRISATDLASRVSQAVLVQVLDDDNDGTPDPAAILLVIEMAEGQTDSYMLPQYQLAQLPTSDRVLRMADIEFAISFVYERHSEYVRSGEAQKHYDRAVSIMKNAAAAIQRLPEATTPPANVGGTSVNVEDCITTHESLVTGDF